MPAFLYSGNEYAADTIIIIMVRPPRSRKCNGLHRERVMVCIERTIASTVLYRANGSNL